MHAFTDKHTYTLLPLMQNQKFRSHRCYNDPFFCKISFVIQFALFSTATVNTFFRSFCQAHIFILLPIITHSSIQVAYKKRVALALDDTYSSSSFLLSFFFSFLRTLTQSICFPICSKRETKECVYVFLFRNFVTCSGSFYIPLGNS